LAQAKETVTRWRLQLAKARRLAEFLRSFNADVERVDDAMSGHARLSAILQQKGKIVGPNLSSSGGEINGRNSGVNEDIKEEQEKKKKPQVKTLTVYKITYLTMDEFDAIPKYMKGMHSDTWVRTYWRISEL